MKPLTIAAVVDTPKEIHLLLAVVAVTSNFMSVPQVVYSTSQSGMAVVKAAWREKGVKRKESRERSREEHREENSRVLVRRQVLARPSSSSLPYPCLP